MRLAGFEVGAKTPLFLIAGPCVIESEALVMSVAERLRSVTAALGMPFVFKASFDKANRSSKESFRGLGIERGLRVMRLAGVEGEVAASTQLDGVFDVEPARRPACHREPQLLFRTLRVVVSQAVNRGVVQA